MRESDSPQVVIRTTPGRLTSLLSSLRSGRTHWQKSSFSEAEGSCVELRRHGGHIGIRESGYPDVVISTSPNAVRAFLTRVRRLP
ncbi:DUF397 domain-containing protein [Streptomyces albireticuli]|uniref:DUF397 domain-containing protein n=2 Tax=Streptomyces albireticuli TaxID=1940 RepID=A0A2A2D7C3_9ACTN|nr:DUF397 domain-containing protein [Streptomyces albireticuli]